MANIELYLCEKCKQIAEKVVATQVPLICCGEEMKKLEAGTVDAAQEKHVPDVTREGNHIKVQVGSTLHPMEDKHYIQFIIVKQGDCTYRADLKPGQEPVAEFDIPLPDEEILREKGPHGLEFNKK